jgi:tetratricopeptide (TPR) repeat protein
MKKELGSLKTQQLLIKALKHCQHGNLFEAKNIYQSLLKIIPSHPDVLGNLGTIELQHGNIEIGVDYLKNSIKKNPLQPTMISNLGNALLELGRAEESIDYFERAIKLQPKDHPEVYYNLGRAFRIAKDFDKAINSYEKALKIDTHHIPSFLNLGFLYNELKQYPLAINCFNEGIKIQPKNIQLIYNRGVSYLNLNSFLPALADFKLVIDLDNQFELAYIQKSITLKYLYRYDEAIVNINSAININNLNADHFNLKATILEYLHQYDDALNHYDIAINLRGNFAEAKKNKALCLLSRNHFDKGWILFESRWEIESYQLPLASEKPLLDDFSIQDKVIYIWSEQGVGDQIIYSSLLLDALKSKNNFFVSVDPRLISLYERSFCGAKNVKFISTKDRLSEADYDFHIPIGSLGKFFRDSIKAFSNHPSGYLKSRTDLNETLEKKLKKTNQRVIGISWLSKNNQIGQAKSLALADLLPLLSIPDTTFINLQYGETAEEIENIFNKYNIDIVSVKEVDNYNDFDGLASLISICDFVITSSNVTAHLSGALNKKTYLLLPHSHGKIWYWGTTGNTSLWYPSIHIFRSKTPDNWHGVIKELWSALK